MDNFSNLKWSSNSSVSSSRNSSKPGTPIPGSGFDSFANLTAIGGKNKQKKLESLSLEERKSMLKEKNESNNTQASSNAWSGLDLLGSDLAGTSATTSATTTATATTATATATATATTTDQVKTNSLLDGFELANEHDAGRVSASAATATPEKDNIDDLFAVFNQPKVAPEPERPAQDRFRADSNEPPHESPHELPLEPHEPKPQRPIRLEELDNEYNDDYNDYDDYSAESKVFKKPVSRSSKRSTPHHIPTPDPRDHAIAELMDMGFTDEQARYALAQTNSGLDIRQAVDVLMSEAHERATGEKRDRSSSSRRRQDAPIEDISKLATDFSNQFISKAGSLWSMSKKNIAKAIEQYNTPGSSDGTPAWMRDAQKYAGSGGVEDEVREGIPSIHLDSDSDRPVRPDRGGRLDRGGRPDRSGRLGRPDRSEFRDSDFDTPTPPPQTTDEALMLESDSARHGRKQRQISSATPPPPPPRRHDAEREPQKPSTPQPTLTRAQLLREKQKDLKDEDVMYVSSSRRRATPGTSQPASRASTPVISKAKPKPPPRQIVAISPTALTIATTAREQGTESFKRGDFTQAIIHYSQALESIPTNHLLQTIILTNRSTCYLKCGDAKSALADAEQSITIIGPGLGAGEEVEPNKPLKDIWSKAISRKAESYEHMEKFQDALESWTILITNGYSSKQSMDGKRRCQDALTPKPKVSATPSRVSTPSGAEGPKSAAGKAAIKKIKDAFENGEKADSEKFALHDVVNTKIENWRHGKEENLRALLASLDNLLWAESGWKKVSLADLVMPKKVKIVYMKAVARTHPDKVSPDATVEQKMIAEGVFITLNKAWDEFKAANGMS